MLVVQGLGAARSAQTDLLLHHQAARASAPDQRSINQETLMTDYVPDVQKYTDNVNTAAVGAIVKYCGIALRKPDSAKVAATDPKELATIRDGFAAKKLGLSAEAADMGIKATAEKMK